MAGVSGQLSQDSPPPLSRAAARNCKVLFNGNIYTVVHNTCSTGTAIDRSEVYRYFYTGTSTGTSTGSMTRGQSIGSGSRTDTALRSGLLSTISYLVRLASSFLFFLRCVY